MTLAEIIAELKAALKKQDDYMPAPAGWLVLDVRVAEAALEELRRLQGLEK